MPTGGDDIYTFLSTQPYLNGRFASRIKTLSRRDGSDRSRWGRHNSLISLLQKTKQQRILVIEHSTVAIECYQKALIESVFIQVREHSACGLTKNACIVVTSPSPTIHNVLPSFYFGLASSWICKSHSSDPRSFLPRLPCSRSPLLAALTGSTVKNHVTMCWPTLTMTSWEMQPYLRWHCIRIYPFSIVLLRWTGGFGRPDLCILPLGTSLVENCRTMFEVEGW